VRQLGADVGEDQIAPAIQGHQAVASGQVAAQLPFVGMDFVFHAGDVQAHGNVSFKWDRKLNLVR
jgi:hypothetical protein